MADQSSADGLVSVLLDPTRLRIVATLAAAGEVEFAFVRDRVGLSDSALSKQLSTLADAELIATRRGRTGARRRVWVHLSTHGRHTLAAHSQALRDLADTANHADTT